MQVSWLVLKNVGWGLDVKINSVSFWWIHIVWENLNWHLSTWSALTCRQRGTKTDLEVYSSILPREKFSNYLGIKGWVQFSTVNPQSESNSMKNSRLAMWGSVQVPPTRDQLRLKPQKIGSARKKLWYVGQNVNLLLLESLVLKKEVHIWDHNTNINALEAFLGFLF